MHRVGLDHGPDQQSEAIEVGIVECRWSVVGVPRYRDGDGGRGVVVLMNECAIVI